MTHRHVTLSEARGLILRLEQFGQQLWPRRTRTLLAGLVLAACAPRATTGIASAGNSALPFFGSDTTAVRYRNPDTAAWFRNRIGNKCGTP